MDELKLLFAYFKEHKTAAAAVAAAILAGMVIGAVFGAMAYYNGWLG